MNWRVVAAKDFRDTIRTQAIWALSALFIGVLSAVTIGFTVVAHRPSFPGLLTFLSSLVIWLVPITALVVGYKAIVGEREDGTLTILLSLPLSRWDAIFGKTVGRASAVVASVVVGFGVMAGISVVLYQRFFVGLFVLFVALGVLLALVFVSIAVAISAVTRSAVRAASGAVGTFILFTFLWDLVPAGVYFLLNGEVVGNKEPPQWYYFVQHLNPSNAFTFLVTDLAPTLMSPVSQPAPFYLSPDFIALIMALWVVVPFAIGYYRFRTTELT